MTKKIVKQEEEKPKEEEEKPEEEKAEESPKWALELKASFDKMADAFSRFAEAKVDKQEPEEEEEEKPEEEEKQEEEEEEEEEKPKEEEKVEKVEFFEEEGKKGKKKDKIDEYIKEEVAKKVEEALKKSLGTEPVKRSKAIKKVKVTEDISMAELHDMPWSEVRKLVEARGGL